MRGFLTEGQAGSFPLPFVARDRMGVRQGVRAGENRERLWNKPTITYGVLWSACKRVEARKKAVQTGRHPPEEAEAS